MDCLEVGVAEEEDTLGVGDGEADEPGALSLPPLSLVSLEVASSATSGPGKVYLEPGLKIYNW